MGDCWYLLGRAIRMGSFSLEALLLSMGTMGPTNRWSAMKWLEIFSEETSALHNQWAYILHTYCCFIVKNPSLEDFYILPTYCKLLKCRFINKHNISPLLSRPMFILNSEFQLLLFHFWF